MTLTKIDVWVMKSPMIHDPEEYPEEFCIMILGQCVAVMKSSTLGYAQDIIERIKSCQ